VSITVVPVQGSTNQAPLQLSADNYVPGTAIPATGPNAGSNQTAFGASGSAQTTYVFDAVLELDHEQRLEKTHHPVQTGADISSHAYLQAPRLVLSIGMSDAMDAYASGANNANQAGNATPDTTTPFSGGSVSKSVNAYQTMIALQVARSPLTITTRLRTYTNMLITAISPREDYKTITGLRMRIEFEQVFTASTVVSATSDPTSGLSPVSARPDVTAQTGLGQANTSAVPATTQTQFQVPQRTQQALNGADSYLPGGSLLDMYEPMPVNVPGAGNYSSVPGQQALP